MSGPSLQAAVRVQIYRFFLDRGRAPSACEVAATLERDAVEIERAFLELARQRVITLEPDTRSIRMAHPFSAVPTPYRVRANGTSYWANCAWDAFGIAAMLDRDTEAIAHCPDCDSRIDLGVHAGSVAGEVGVIHFAVPLQQFWENIAFT